MVHHHMTLLVLAWLCLYIDSSWAQVVEVQAAGATFPATVYQRWTFGFSQFDDNAAVSYEAVGSGEGKRRITANEVTWAGSDSALSDEQYMNNSGLQMYPMLGGAVVVVYNVRTRP